MSWGLCELMLICNGQGLVWVMATGLPPAMYAGDRVTLILGCFTGSWEKVNQSLPAHSPEHHMDEHSCKLKRTPR